MTRTEALEIARVNRNAYRAADIEHMFRGAPEPVKADYGYHHGWFAVGEFNFCEDEITGQKYDPNQGGWAYL